MSKRESYKDPNGRHVRIYCSLLESPAYCALSRSARALFLDLRSKLGKTNNGDISATLSVLKHRGWRSSETLANALFELQALGFIAKTREGGVRQGSKVCCLYRFTDLPIADFPKFGIEAMHATHDYLKFKGLTEAKRALEAAQAERKGDDNCKKRALRNSPRAGSKIEAATLDSDLVFEEERVPSVRLSKSISGVPSELQSPVRPGS